MGTVPVALMGCLGCDDTYAVGSERCPACGTRSPMFVPEGVDDRMPKTTSGGASSALEEVSDAVDAASQPAPVAAAEPATPDTETPTETPTVEVSGEHGPELDVPLATGGLVTPGQVEPVGDGSPPPFVLPPGWTSGPTSATAAEPAAQDPQPDAAPEQPAPADTPQAS